MPATPQMQAIVNANNVVGIGQQLLSLQGQLQAITTLNATVPFGTEWALMATTSLTSDGGLGTADLSPVTSHPIDPRVYTGLNQSLSATQYAALLALCVAASQLLAGTAIAANAATPGTLASVAA